MSLHWRISPLSRSAKRGQVVERPPDLITGWHAQLFIGSAAALTALIVIGTILLALNIAPAPGLILSLVGALLTIILCSIVEWRVRR